MPVKPTSPAPPARILIVDDDPGQRSLLESFLRSQGFATTTASSGEQALALLDHEEIRMMISDVRMPGMTGLETLREARRRHAVLPVLLVTAYADVREAVGAMRDGALDYLTKPIDLDELLAAVRKGVGLEEAPRSEAVDAPALPAHVIARSPAMRAAFRDASVVAASDSRVLITGESGVGKEILADVIHHWSPRAREPIVKINCAAIPEALLESELFGHEKGAFTGAVAERIGRFEEAENGTLLLDEIAEATIDGSRKQHMELLSTVSLLIIDDLGMRKLPSNAAEDLLEIVMRRYERASTLMTSNRPVEDWGKLLGDSAAVTAMLDRLLHHGHVLKCGPRSWRTKTDLLNQEVKS